MSKGSGPLSDLLLGQIPEPALARGGGSGVEKGAHDDLEGTLERALDAAKQASPGVDVPPDVFLRYLAARLAGTDASSIEQALAAVRTSELYLACACDRGDRVALAIFDRRFVADLDAAVRRMDRSGGAADDIKQVVRQKLFVGEPGGHPKIREYSGRGDLRRWVRAIAVRAAIDAGRADREVPVPPEDDLFELLSVPADHPEVAHLKQASRAEIKAALREALDTLPERERALLQQYYLDGANLEALAALYHVAPSTVSRSLAKARSTLLLRVRGALMTRLRLTGREVDSLVRLVQSQLDVSQAMLGRSR